MFDQFCDLSKIKNDFFYLLLTVVRHGVVLWYNIVGKYKKRLLSKNTVRN